MQYKISPTDVLWSPKDGSTIRLWRKDVARWPKLPMGVPNLVPL
jgi:hypothetical protein